MLGAAVVGPGAPARAVQSHTSHPAQSKGSQIYLSEFQPKSMLTVPATEIERAKFPVIDIHTHLSFAAVNTNGVPMSEKLHFLAEPDALLAVMDRRHIHTLVDVTGGFGQGLVDAVRKYHTPHPDRFLIFTEPWYPKTNQTGYPKFQADAIEKAHQSGARGLKVLKTLGLYLRQNVTSGPLIKIDDRRFDTMWDACGNLGMPVVMHTADPDAFFLPTNRFNERYEELNNHPDWSFYGKDFPSKRELLEARTRVFARHPRTQFVALHIASLAGNLAEVAALLDRLPNVYVETAARINELGRQPRNSRKFFDKYQDRIIFGTDAVPPPYGNVTPQQIFGDKLYQIYCRFFETEDEYFDYAPAPKPPQGRWQIYGIGLPDTILRKVYYENAARLLKVKI
jgi:predicted TIM-barrel fold metal-dependent hydrolase